MRKLALAALGAVLLAGFGSASAVTRGSQAMRDTVTYCVESAPSDVGMTRARQLLDTAIARWGQPTHASAGSTALTLVQQIPCLAGTNVRVAAAVLADPKVGASTTSTRITFNTTFAWWDGIGTRLDSEVSYLGVLMHEMGHTFGMGHSGKTKWSYDTATPTMSDAVTAADSVSSETLQQDDWGLASMVRGGEYRFWSANPGFESGFQFWGRTSGTSTSGSYGYTGTGARIATSSDYLWITSVYDPYAGKVAGAVAPNMTTTPTLYGRTWYKNPTAGATGGLKLRSQYRYLQYDSGKTKATADATATHTSWSAISDLATCSATTSWKTCIGSKSLANSTTNDATVFRLYLLSTTTNGAVYADRLAAFGGVS